MRKVEPNSISDFVLGKFRETTLSILKARLATEVSNEKKILQDIARVEAERMTELRREEAVSGFKKTLRRTQDRKASWEKRMKALMEVKPEVFEKELKKHPHYDGYFLDNEKRLNLYTKMLKDGAKNLGRFRICILDDQSGGVNFRAVNLDYYAGELDHWAINGRRCCLGEWQLDFDKFLREADIPKFFELFVLYVTLSPENNTYTKKDDWYDQRKKRSKTDHDIFRERNVMNLYNPEGDESEEDEDESLF